VPDYSWAERDDWEDAWQPAIDAVGTDFAPEILWTAADPIEQGAVRRYLEPLEFDCPLHYDAEVARAHGYPAIVAPYSGLVTWSSPGVWMPGEDPVYTAAERDAQPPRRFRFPRAPGPDVNAVTATDIEYEYFRPLLVGDLLHRRGYRLLAVVPKQTRVGRGAFLTYESDFSNQDDLLVAQTRMGIFEYVAGAGSQA
jgi:hypothetical protein